MPTEIIVAIAGNPNVGKSTVFNHLTKLRQHTGNWTGKTVSNAEGFCRTTRYLYKMVDIPGTYSLLAHSEEEAVARDFICFGGADMIIVVCDATCIERNLNLVLQILEITTHIVLCVNLLDEADKKGIQVDLDRLSELLNIHVVGVVARDGQGMERLLNKLDECVSQEHSVLQAQELCKERMRVTYSEVIETAIAKLEPAIREYLREIPDKWKQVNARWLSLHLLNSDEREQLELTGNFMQCVEQTKGYEAKVDVREALREARNLLDTNNLHKKRLEEEIVSSVMEKAERITAQAVTCSVKRPDLRDRKIDRIVTSRLIGYPIMGILLLVILWITITGANYPSQVLSQGLFWIQERLTEGFIRIGAPAWLHGMLVLGMYRVLAWVVAVMLPPMAIFFPLFTLLEDSGYLPRIAYNLDKPFKKCCACGKQALCMAMGFGCNAVGVMGCRIIDSPRERLIAILTNSFVPCNGRFPTLIAIITMFFVGIKGGIGASILSATILTMFILLGVGMTLLVSYILSKTVLKGLPSSFILELPPYRRPQIGKVIVRSILDRTVFVLGRAVIVAAPAGILIWLSANIMIEQQSLLNYSAQLIDPFARAIGLDGVILIAFILAFPANEILVPIIIMAYLAQGSMQEMGSLVDIKTLFVQHGWTWVTAICTMIFSLMHWPCSTTLLTIKKETGSWKWTIAAFLLPTLTGMIVCFLVAHLAIL